MDQSKMDLGILKETNLTRVVRAQELLGYHIMALDAPILHYGNMLIFYIELLRFSVEGHQQHDPNVVSF